jgi:hypothetical protein
MVSRARKRGGMGDMRGSNERKARHPARRSTSRDDEPQRRVSAGVEWPRPTRRARMLAAALAMAFAAITFAIVALLWHRAAPPPRATPTSVEVKLVPTTPAPR